MAAQRKQLSMACNSLRGKPCAVWTMFFGSLKRTGDRATASVGFLHFTQQQYRVAAELLAADKPQAVSYYLPQTSGYRNGHILMAYSSLRGGLLHFVGAELDPN